MTATKLTMTVRIAHRSSIQRAFFCTPVGWEPANQFEGSEYLEGAWWDSEEETHGMVAFDAGQNDWAEDAVVEVEIDDLRIAKTGSNMGVVAKVEIPLLAIGNALAVKIEEAAEEFGVTYAAEQNSYGVEAEEVEGGVRFFDCDGERSKVCTTVAELEAEAEVWINLIEQTAPVTEEEGE